MSRGLKYVWTSKGMLGGSTAVLVAHDTCFGVCRVNLDFCRFPFFFFHFSFFTG